jgi:hypothetical protein
MFLCMYDCARPWRHSRICPDAPHSLDDPLIWGILPLRYVWNVDNMRWGLGSYDLCFQNKYVTGPRRRRIAMLMVWQGAFNLLYTRTSPPHPALSPLAIWRPLPTYHNSSDPSPLTRALHPRERTSTKSRHISLESRPLRSIFQQSSHLLHKWARHVPGTRSVPDPSSQLGAHIP